jgi:Uma2 family endonuclease
MSTILAPSSQAPVEYPDSDGEPMAENTLQYEWIVTIQGNLDALFQNNPDVFIATDNLWYPVEGDPKTRQAPDVYAVFGRPKGHRGSYRQWEEGGVPIQVVFEILSPGNRPAEMTRKFRFYERHRVEEYYIYDPDANELSGYVRGDSGLDEIQRLDGWISPRLGIRFDLSSGPELQIYRTDGQRFLTFVELRQQAERERALVDRESQRADRESQRADREHDAAERLRAQLRALGINPDA